MNNIKSKQTLEDFYYGKIVPCEHPAETPATRELWKSIITKENDFTKTLNEEQEPRACIHLHTFYRT